MLHLLIDSVLDSRSSVFEFVCISLISFLMLTFATALRHAVARAAFFCFSDALLSRGEVERHQRILIRQPYQFNNLDFPL